MVSLSYIVDGSQLDEAKILKIDSLLDVASKKLGQKIECVAFMDNGKSLCLKYFTSVSSKDASISPISKAITCATGRALIYTTADNLMQDADFAMARIAIGLKDYQTAFPHEKKRFLSAIGIRYAKNIPYLIVREDYARHNIELFNRPEQLIKSSNSNLALVSLSSRDNYPSTVLSDVIFFRPYMSILRFHLMRMKKKVSKLLAQQRQYLKKLFTEKVSFSNKIPVFIICRDRVEPLKKLVSWCEQEGLKNIILIDNASTYPPLLEYFEQTPHEVVRLRSNVGHTAPWILGLVDLYSKNKPYIVTDPDIIPVEGAHGAVKFFSDLLNKYPDIVKVGFGLKIDDLPDAYELKEHVVAWEGQFWEKKVEDGVYDADIDTTFALYRKNTPYVIRPALRTTGNFMARHEPWYTNSKRISRELKYYRTHADKVIGSWGVTQLEATETYESHKKKSA